MSTDLREELDALARTQSFSPDPSAWDRGRRARRRTRVAAGAAAVAVVAVVAGAGALVLLPDQEARTASSEVVEGGAVPSVIEDVPEDLGLTTDLAVGRASAAFVSATGDPVVVTAIDGVPYRLALPGWDPKRRALALSPDGRAVAYQRPDGGDTVIAQLDLESGSEDVLFRQPGEELTYDTLTWSPGGDWLAWSSSRFGDVPAVGKVRPGEARTTVLPFTPTGVAVADGGAVAIASRRGGLFLPMDGQRDLGRVTTDLSAGVGAFSPNGRYLALATAPDTASYTLDVESRDVLQHPFPEATLGESVVRPLGWLDDRRQLLLVQEVDGPSAELVVTTPEVDATSTWRRSVGSVEDSGVASSLTLAVDLVPDLDGTSSQELTHDFGRPTSPDDGPGRAPYVLGGLAALLAGLAFVRMLRAQA